MVDHENVMEELFTVLQLAKTHQAAISAAILGFEAERDALARERSALMHAAATLPVTLRDAVDELSNMTRSVAPALQKAAGSAISAALGESLPEVSKTAIDGFSEASKPFIGNLTGAIKAIEKTEGKLSQTVAAGGWLLFGMVCASVVSSFFATLLALWLFTS